VKRVIWRACVVWRACEGNRVRSKLNGRSDCCPTLFPLGQHFVWSSVSRAQELCNVRCVIRLRGAASCGAKTRCGPAHDECASCTKTVQDYTLTFLSCRPCLLAASSIFVASTLSWLHTHTHTHSQRESTQSTHTHTQSTQSTQSTHTVNQQVTPLLASLQAR
jgi:hypothetical protein